MSELRSAGRQFAMGVGCGIALGISLLCVPLASAGKTDALGEVLNRVRSQIAGGNLQAAKSDLQGALKQYPTQAGLYDLLGVVNAQQKDTRAAEQNFKRAIALDPRLAGAYLNLGHLYQEQSASAEMLKKALTIYQQVLAFDPDNGDASYQAAVVSMRLGNYGTSLELLGHLPNGDGSRAQVLAIQCADIAGTAGHAETDACIQQLLASPDLAESDVLTIIPALERQGNLSKARDLLEKQAASHPGSVPALMDLARVAERQADYKGALGYLAHARDLEPSNAEVSFFFGVVCLEANLVQDAYAALKAAVDEDPNKPGYYLALGLAELEQDKIAAAEAFKQYCSKVPLDPRGHFGLGVAYFDKGEYDSAMREFSPLKANALTAAGAHFYLGRIDEKQARLEAAESEFEQAVKLDPNYAEANAELGHTRFLENKFPLAEEALRKALADEPANYVAQLNLMLLYQKTKDPRAPAEANRLRDIRKQIVEHNAERLRRIVIQR